MPIEGMAGEMPDAGRGEDDASLEQGEGKRTKRGFVTRVVAGACTDDFSPFPQQKNEGRTDLRFLPDASIDPTSTCSNWPDSQSARVERSPSSV